MSENGGSFWSQHFGNILIAAIGALGAILAAVVPIYLNRSEPPPPPPAPSVSPTAPGKEAGERTGAGKEKESRPQVLLDLERLQGQWEAVSRELPAEFEAKARAKAARAKAAGRAPLANSASFLWTFHGNELKSHAVRPDGTDGPTFTGTFTLRQDRRGVARLFDFHGRGPDGNEFTWSGVYEFDGEFLRVCYRYRRSTEEPDPAQAVAFNTDVDHGGGLLLKFKRKV